MYRLILLCLVVVFLGCKTEEKTAVEKTDTTPTEGETKNEVKEPQTNPEEPTEPNGRILYNPKLSNMGAHKDINEVSISGNTLQVNVSYSGGCKEHSFELVHKKEMTKSMPPILTVYLVHENNEDYCEEYITENLQFDLSDLGKQTGEKEIKLQFAKSKQVVTYKVK